MGNTPSQGKKSGATERNFSIQEEHDPLDDEAAEAASQAIVNEEKPSLSDMPGKLLDIIGKHLTLKDRREFAATDRRMHSVFHQSDLHAKFLEW